MSSKSARSALSSDGEGERSSSRTAWAVAVPIVGVLVIVLFAAVMLVVISAFGRTPLSRSGPRSVKAVEVVNRCSRAAAVGWVAFDPSVPLDQEQARRFFPPASYVGDEEWPEMDPYGVYPNQTGVIAPGESASLEVAREGASRRLILVGTFRSRGAQDAGAEAPVSVEVFEAETELPDSLVLLDSGESCAPAPPLDRRYPI